MASGDPFTRRRVLRLSGVAAVTTFVAGCTDEGPGDEEEGDDEADAGNEENENGNDEVTDVEDGEEENGETIEPGTTILFDGQTEGWVGIEPSEIDGEENPTLTLETDETYEIGWEGGDGAAHNIEIRDEDGDVVDDLETEMTDEPDDGQLLEVTASEAMVQYVCNPHETTMVGDIEVE